MVFAVETFLLFQNHGYYAAVNGAIKINGAEDKQTWYRGSHYAAAENGSRKVLALIAMGFHAGNGAPSLFKMWTRPCQKTISDQLTDEAVALWSLQNTWPAFYATWLIMLRMPNDNPAQSNMKQFSSQTAADNYYASDILLIKCKTHSTAEEKRTVWQ